MAKLDRLVLLGLFFAIAGGCSDDNSDNMSEAVRHGVGAECAVDNDCLTEGAACLAQFKGGYCGLSQCTADDQCPAGSVCVAHEGTNYCFLTCLEKVDCNVGRSVANESNCVSNITFVNSANKGKACVPPNGG